MPSLTQDADEIVEIVRTLAPSFGGFCLESIAAPKCFTIESRIRKAVRMAVLHHENHAAGIIVLAAVINALKVVGKNLQDVRLVISGAGAAGIGVAKGLIVAGNNNIVLCDRHGAIHVYRPVGMNWAKSEIARLVGPQDVKGSLAQVIKGADVFIGLSAGGLVTPEMIAGMAPDPIVFALALPVPGDQRGGGQGRRRRGGGHRPVGQRKPDPLFSGDPGVLPGLPGRGGQPGQHRHVPGRGSRPGRHDSGREIIPHQHHSPADGLAHLPGDRPGGGPGGPGDRRRLPGAGKSES